MANRIESGDLIRDTTPGIFFAGIVVGEAVHRFGPAWIVEYEPDKRSAIFKDNAELWVKEYRKGKGKGR